MKPPLSLLSLWLLCLLMLTIGYRAAAQTPSADQNYVLTKTFRGAGATQPVATIEYVDGLGRSVQSVGYRASPGQKDIVTSVTYDAFGRTDKTYLPAPATGGTGALAPDQPAQAVSFYGDNVPYTQPVYEASPLNRVQRQFGAGNAWRTADRAVGMSYLVAGAGEVRLWTTTPGAGTTAGTLTSSGFYAAGELYKTQTSDENRNLVIEYKDKQGLVVQKNVQDGGTAAAPTWMVTSYVYDDFDRRAYVIPPKLYAEKVATATGTVTLSDAADAELLFAYRYDGRGRMIEKLVPGGGWTHIVYNKIDQPVLTQHARQREQGRWSFTKYDPFGRVALAGEMASTADRAALQTQADAATVQFENRTTGGVFGYSNNAFPSVTAAQVNLASYYDDYNWGVPTALGFVPFNNLTQKPARGLATGSIARVIGQGDIAGTLLTSVTYYDEKNRPVQTFAQNPFGGYTRSDLSLSFGGELLSRTASSSYTDGKTGYTTVTGYQYDHVGRKTRTNHAVGSGTTAPQGLPLAQYVYDEVGRLVQKRIQPGTYRTIEPLPDTTTITRNTAISGTVTDKAGKITLKNGFSIAGGGSVYTAEPNAPRYGQTAALQVMDYRYNIRGWLTALNGGTINSTENDLFAMQLNYQEDGINYNGNISGQSWLSHNVKTAPARRYAYTYDAANRLTGATYSGGKYSGENSSLSGMQYDKNGNILALSRSGMRAGTPTAPTAFGAVDGLSYTYQAGSNKLSAVSDAVNSNQAVGDFRDGNTVGNDYEYYSDGSLSRDKNKGITTISYNYLGLVETVQVNGSGQSGTINFYYDATGRKWRKKVYNQTSQQTALTDYDGEIVFETDPSQGKTHALSFIAHEEGRLIPDPQSGQLVYEYHYKDHLGNLRVAFRQQRPQNTQASLSMEPQLALREEAAFENVAQNRVAGPAHSGNYAARVEHETGPGKTVKLQAGETLKASVFAHLEESGKKRTNWIPVPVLGDEPTMVDGKMRKKPVIRGGIALPVKFGKKHEELPEAYLQLIAKDSSGKVVSLQTARVSKAAVGDWEELNLTYQAKEEQTVEVNVVNSSAQTAVYFDDLQLTQEPPLIVQENHYDPWGLNLVGIETTGNPNHKYQYLNREKQEEFGLNWLDLEARMYGPPEGRFWSVDPLPDTEGQESLSPYQYAWNNPVNKSDPDGKLPSDPPSGASLAVHTALDVVGLIPGFGEIADGANALIYLAEGNKTDAALSAAAMIPIAGWAATAGKAVRTADKVVDAVKSGNKLADATKAAAKACGCFTESTLVLTEQGKKKIKDIKVGDKVWAFDEKSSRLALKLVTHTFTYQRDTIYYVKVGSELLETTSDHPFFIGGKWLKVKELRVGQFVKLYSGQELEITSIDIVPQQTKVYNFTVADFHTYYVSNLAVLVHNSGPCDPNLAKAGEDLYVGTYSTSYNANKKTGLNKTHTPHHAVQDAVSTNTHSSGVTINLQKGIHKQTATYKRPVRDISGRMSGAPGANKNNKNPLRVHLAADVKELRNLLKNNGYDQTTINRQLSELIRQNNLGK